MTLTAFCNFKELTYPFENCIQMLLNFEHGCRHFEFCVSLLPVTVVPGQVSNLF